MTNLRDAIKAQKEITERRQAWAKKAAKNAELKSILSTLKARKVLTIAEYNILNKYIEQLLFEISGDLQALKKKEQNKISLSHFKKETLQLARSIDRLSKSLRDDQIIATAIDDAFSSEPFDSSLPEQIYKSASQADVTNLFEQEINEGKKVRQSYLALAYKIALTLKHISSEAKKEHLSYYLVGGHLGPCAEIVLHSETANAKARFVISARINIFLNTHGISSSNKTYPIICDINNFLVEHFSPRFKSKLGFRVFESENQVKDLTQTIGWRSLFKK